MSKPIRVLVAAHDPDCRAMLSSALRPEQGYALTLVSAVAEAADALDRDAHDVVMLDLRLPDAEGLAAVALIRAHAGSRPVVVLADPADEATALRAVKAGCAEYLLKDQVYPTLITRSVQYAVQRGRDRWRRRRAERALAASERRYRSLFELSRDAIYMTDREGLLLEANEAALELLGYTAEELVGRDVASLYADPGDRELFRRELEARGAVRDFEVRLLRQDHVQLWCLVSAWVRHGEDGEVLGYQGILHDYSERKRVEEQLAHQAFHDTLTGLPNRALFMDRLDRALARRRRGEERELAVLFLDLDRFKLVNDSLGHMIGDELLRQVSMLLRGEVREEDTVARLGGDEFAVLLDSVDDAADPTHVARRIQTRLSKPFRLKGHDVFTSASIGITFGGPASTRAEDLLRDADTAMYRAKEGGPARYQIFDEAMHAHAVSILQLETDMRLALERREFVLHYQPLLSTASGDIAGFEALIRWRHPSRGLLAPEIFIPLAEETGMIVSVGDWVLREACRQLRVWQERHSSRANLFVAVNLSARQLAAQDLVVTVRRALKESGLAPRSLKLELTESAVVKSPETASRTLRALRALGVGLCIDDFGTGYSSLSQLHELPVDTLKIDRSFVARLVGGSGGGVVATLVALARDLGIHAVAEGVETEAQLELLRELGPSLVQGFLFSIPVDELTAGALLDERLPGAGAQAGR